MDNPVFAAGRGKQQESSLGSSVSQGVAEVERRLRTLEERFSNLERRSQVTEENMLSSNRKIKAEIKLTTGELSEVKAQIAELSEKVKAVVRELQDFARIEDVDVIKKYLNLIEPLGFVTQSELERAARQAVEEALAEQVNEQGAEK